MHKILAALAAAALAGGLAACGGSKPSGSAAGAASHPSTATTATQPAAGSPSAPAGGSSGSSSGSPSSGAGAGSSGAGAGSGGSSSPPAGGDNSITEYGHAASEAVKSQVAATVKTYYEKLAAHDGAGACAMLGQGIKHQLEMLLSRAPSLHSRGCAGVIEAFFSNRNPAAAASLADVNVHGVRVQGKKAFALISTRTTKNAALLMVEEGGSWKVNTLVGFPLTP